MDTQSLPPSGAPKLLQRVRALHEIQMLIEDAEIATGRAGRCFIVAGAERLCYRIYWRTPAFQVERLSRRGHVLDRRLLLPRDFHWHTVVEALACGQLFTPCEPRA